MIVARTKLTKIPETCTKCKFSYAPRIITAGGLIDVSDSRICILLNKQVPYVFSKEKNNWMYTKCKNCPLTEIKDII